MESIGRLLVEVGLVVGRTGHKSSVLCETTVRGSQVTSVGGIDDLPQRGSDVSMAKANEGGARVVNTKRWGKVFSPLESGLVSGQLGRLSCKQVTSRQNGDRSTREGEWRCSILQKRSGENDLGSFGRSRYAECRRGVSLTPMLLIIGREVGREDTVGIFWRDSGLEMVSHQQYA
jgi:hypothetical protein